MDRRMPNRHGYLTLTVILFLVFPVPSDAQNANMGADYNGIEALASRIVTRFRDGCVSTTQRTASSGYVTEARMEESAGDGTLVRTTYSVISKQLLIDGFEAADLPVAIPGAFEPSIDWLNAQACSLLGDARAVQAPNRLPSELAWTGEFFRHVSAPSTRTLRDMSSSTVSIVADFPSERVSTTVLESGAGVSRDAFLWESTVTDRSSGALVGRVRWSESRQALQFSFPGLTRDAVITPGNLGRPFGGEFNAAWGTVQAFAFKHYLELRRRNVAHQHGGAGLVAVHSGAPLPKSPSPRGATAKTSRYRVVTAGNEVGVAATRAAAPTSASSTLQVPPDELNDGCTYLWYLNVIFKPCCDLHDICYNYGSCSSASWWVWEFWMWGSGWYCAACNAAVMYCFLDTACQYLGGLACI